MINEFTINLIKPHASQLKVLNSPKRFVTLLAGRRFGKSAISACISISNAANQRYVAYVTPTYALAKIFFEEILELMPNGLVTSNKTDLTITFLGGGYIQFFTGERLDLFRSRKFHYVIVDEAAFIPDLENGWLKAIRPTLTDYQGKALFISTPKGKDYFYQLYNKGLDELETDWVSFHFSTFDNPHISLAEIETARLELPEAVFNQEYLAIAGESTSTIVATKYIVAGTLKELSTEPTAVYGIDISSGSNDYCVITGLSHTGNMTYFDRWRSPDFDILYNKVKALPAEKLKVIDKTGIGTPALHELNKSVQNIIGYTISTTTKPELIKNMILGIEQGNLKFNEHTANELSIFEYTYTSTGHLKYGNKAGSANYDDSVISMALAYKHLPNATLSNNFLGSFGFI
ncbi:terminase large subunit domain-containing protein [Pedobacter agri]|uniref:terminase large subunit domain-containing protein n=1 Tax=Pedobacter agri TaxID=454586 RepID=UPI002930654F|nr:terminase family protein [Pedobacter agri]